jgi:hypothetical protein
LFNGNDGQRTWVVIKIIQLEFYMSVGGSGHDWMDILVAQGSDTMFPHETGHLDFEVVPVHFREGC